MICILHSGSNVSPCPLCSIPVVTYDKNIKLKVFLYLLLRDRLTFGTVEGILQEMDKICILNPTFSDTAQAKYVESLIERLS